MKIIMNSAIVNKICPHTLQSCSWLHAATQTAHARRTRETIFFTAKKFFILAFFASTFSVDVSPCRAGTMPNRTILHVDINNCYASIEICFRPEPRGKPIAGDVEARHGIIHAKSQEAKNFCVRTGEALFQAKQKCPGLIILPPNFHFPYNGFQRAR